MSKHLKKNPISLILLFSTIGCLVGFTLFAVAFSSIFFILIGGAVGLMIYAISCAKGKAKSKKEIVQNDDKKGDK